MSKTCPTKANPATTRSPSKVKWIRTRNLVGSIPETMKEATVWVGVFWDVVVVDCSAAFDSSKREQKGVCGSKLITRDKIRLFFNGRSPTQAWREGAADWRD